jgi:two-component system chemotaxis response regulator CheY
VADVLIVDDSPFMRNMLKDILAQVGHQVIGEAKNGSDAVIKYKALNPELVLMDIVMPGSDGIEAVNAIMDQDPRAKIVMCTSLGQKKMVLDAFYAGAKDYIVKPFQSEKVIDVINKTLLL